MIKELLQNFKEQLQQEQRPYVLEIYTPTCGVCQQVAPFFEQVANEHGATYGFYKINAEEVEGVADEYGVSSVPTFIFVKNGSIKEQHHGYITKEELVTKLTELFG